MKRHAYTYEELRRIGQRYYADSNFCAVVAAATATQLGFGRVFHSYRRQGRRTGGGTATGATLTFIKQHQCDLVQCPADQYGRTVTTTLRNLPNNAVWLVRVRGHIFTVEYGTVHDWMQSNRRHRITGLWKVIRKFEEAQRNKVEGA